MLNQDKKPFKSLCVFVCVFLYCNDRENKKIERGTESDRSGVEITIRDKEMWTVEKKIERINCADLLPFNIFILIDLCLQNRDFCGWLAEVENDPYRAQCISCKCTLTAGHSELLKHCNTRSHKNAARVIMNHHLLEHTSMLLMLKKQAWAIP